MHLYETHKEKFIIQNKVCIILVNKIFFYTDISPPKDNCHPSLLNRYYADGKQSYLSKIMTETGYKEKFLNITEQVL